MHAAALGGGGGAVGGGSGERVRELARAAHLEQAGVHRRVGRGQVEAERARRHDAAGRGRRAARRRRRAPAAACRRAAGEGAARSSPRSCWPPAGCPAARIRRRARRRPTSRGSSSSASGLPWLSVMICSQTAASSGPCMFSSSSARASLSPRPRTGSLGEAGEDVVADRPCGRRTRARPARRGVGGRRSRGAARRRGRATARRRRCRSAAVARPPRRTASAWRARRGTGPVPGPRCNPKTVASASRCGAGRRSR